MYPETTRGPEISINITSWIRVPLKVISNNMENSVGQTPANRPTGRKKNQNSGGWFLKNLNGWEPEIFGLETEISQMVCILELQHPPNRVLSQTATKIREYALFGGKNHLNQSIICGGSILTSWWFQFFEKY